MDLTQILIVALAVAAGGMLKGAIGVGAPILGVPVIALYTNVPFAVSVFVLPNLMSNIWQSWTYRHHLTSPRFYLGFALAGGLGAFFGSILLAYLPGSALEAALAGIVFLYIGIRLLHPDWTLARALGERLAAPAGLLSGIMQGAGGLSAPVSVTFLNAMRLERGEFIATVSVLFFSMSVVQIPSLWGLGILTPHVMALSLGVCLPLFGAMPVGAWLARRVSREAFDRTVLILLAVIAVKLVWGALVP